MHKNDPTLTISTNSQQNQNEIFKINEDWYRTAVENSNDGIALVKGDNILFVNKRFLEMFGYDAHEEVLGKKITIVIHSDDRERVIKLNRARQEGAPTLSRYEFKGITKKEETKYIEVSAVRTVYNNESASLAFLRDVTERMEAEKKISEQLSLLQALIDAVPNPIFYKDISGKYLGCNKAFEELLDLKKENLIGKATLDLNYLNGEVPISNADVDRPGQKTYELKFVDKNGIDRTMISKNVTFTNSDNIVTGIVGIIIDITEQKLAEEAMKNAMVVFDAANKAKSDFLANMSHEIRTPMNSIIGMVDLLLGSELTQEQRDFLNITKTSADALLKIINDILDFSKIESGKIEFEKIDFDLRVTVEDAVDTFAAKASEKGLELACLINYDIPSLLRGDPGRLRQILLNLIGNAIKFTEAGEVSITAELEHEDENSATIRFRVFDTGIGIPEDKIEKLFKSFSQIDASQTRRYGGTGLGLAISRRLALMMGGKIGVNSVVAGGSTFWFTAVFEKQLKITPNVFNKRVETQDQRILVVDDNKTNRFVLSKMLEYWRFKHDEAENAIEALNKLREGMKHNLPFTIAILDMQMPDVDGETLGRTIKNDKDLSKVQLIMLSSFGKRGDASRLKEVGFSAFLTKPIKGSQLLDCLLSVIREEHIELDQRRIITRFSITEDKKRRLRILVAEDNIPNQKLLLLVLNKLGYNADIVYNGKEVIESLTVHNYDLILMDVQMPEMDGLEATKIIREKEKNTDRHIPIIAMTANAMYGDRERCIEAGMDDYISKPFPPEKVVEVIEKIILKKEKIIETETMPDNRESVFDKEALKKRLDIDDNLVGEIMEVYLTDTPIQLSKLNDAFQKGDLISVQRCAHSIKGASANFCVGVINKTAKEIELVAKQGNISAIKPLIDAIGRQFETFKAILAEDMATDKI